MEIVVHQYLGALSASIATFAATNVDDAFLLTFFFARRIPVRRIVAGQYVGFAAIILLSLIGVWGALAIPHHWIHFLGLLPLAIGIRLLFRKRRSELEPPHINHSGIASIALVTLSNGADNIGVYVPFFVNSRAYLWLILTVYAVMVAIWCAVGRWLGNRSLILRSVDRFGHWAVPLVFIGLGVYILGS
jgi:cadmium resistance protein CadD (predicted permease)